MKGIVLAGGTGSRLFPLTLATNKHLLPVYDKPMIYYPLSTLLLAGVDEILIISTALEINKFKAIFGDGCSLGVKIQYAVQEQPRGIAEAFIVGESFVGGDSVWLILGDNIFQGSGLKEKLQKAISINQGATIFGSYVENPSAYGVAVLDNHNQLIDLIEKPKEFVSHYAIPGLYYYDNTVIAKAKELSPSWRGELEITDINRAYLKEKKINLQILGRGFCWLDVGTHDNLLVASNFIQMLETRQGLKIGVPEEIAWRQKLISTEQFLLLADQLKTTGYGKYLYSLCNTQMIEEMELV